MKRIGRYIVLAIALSMSACLDKCRDGKEVGQAVSPNGSANRDAGSLILAAREQGAMLPVEISDPRYADESTLPMTPFQLPAADLSKAVAETEPNNNRLTATQLGQGMVARGEIVAGDYDHYVFETTGEPQMWAFEVIGKSVGRMSYNPPGNDYRMEAQRIDSTRLVIPNMYLAAGQHPLELQAVGAVPGSYTLRAVALGKPDLRMERESNDAPALAHTLSPGIPRVGFLLDRNDRDIYAFSLREPAHVSLDVKSPPDLAMTLNMSRLTGASYGINATKKGEDVHMEMTLPAGEYFAILRGSENGSLSPYRIKFELLDPFTSLPDREPNNDFQEAAPLPSDLILRGQVGEYVDADWYQLPVLSQETSMSVQVISMTGTMTPRGSIQVVNRSSGSNELLKWPGTDSILVMRLPPNAPLFLQLTHRGNYELSLSFTPGITPAAGKAPFTISMPPGPLLVEAFSTLAQQLPLPVTVTNSGAESIQVELEGVANNGIWMLTPRKTVTVEPGKKALVNLELSIPPDAGAREPVQVAVRAASVRGNASATSKVYALCGANPANGQSYSPLPSSMLGGLNLAAASLGAHPVAPDTKMSREKMLYDGMTPSDGAWTGDRTTSDPDILLTVALAGNRPAMLAGITLVPGVSGQADQVDEFDVLVSEDGQAYRQVTSGRLKSARVEQAFAFPQPVRAAFAQLRVRSNQLGSKSPRSTLGEWKVIAVPGEQPFAAPEFNIADPAVGGHVVWSKPLLPWPSAAVLNELASTWTKLDPTSPNEWVVGFRYNRAAQVSRLEWLQPAAAKGGARMLTKVEVSVSTESPIGPWVPLGSWKINSAPGSVTPLKLSQPVWARFVRFSTTEPRKEAEYWRVAESIRIYERGADAKYRSALGEWGHYSRAATYERMVVAPASPNPEEVTGNGKRDNARKIDSGKSYHGRVMVEDDEDWYRVDVPGDNNKLLLNLQGDPALRAVATVQDESGKVVPSTSSRGGGGVTQVSATVEGGKTYFVRLYEPPRSILLLFDNSGSLRNFALPMYRGMSRMVESVQPRKEFVNLLPFRDDPKARFLLSNWSDKAPELQGAIQNYNRIDASSDAEFALLTAAQALENREGSKAIIMVTDALSPGYSHTSELWSALSRADVRIFTVELQLGNDTERQQRLMQDWADSNDGHYSTFKTGDDMELAFERASCYLRRPARYTLTAEVKFEVPPPPASIESLLAKSGRVDVYGIYFDVGSAVLKPESGPVLKEISDALGKNLSWKLSVEGHTDNVGGETPNMLLSRNRAASVKEALVSRFGIAADRLATTGFGSSKPKESNGTVKGKARNRRVELIRQ